MNTTLLKVLSAAVFFISLSGCSNGDDGSGSKRNNGIGGPSSSLGGSYNITSMVANMFVDLNNDGVMSDDLFTEIDPAFFDPENPELIIKPVLYNNQLEEMMSFYLPHSTVTVASPNNPGSVKFSRNGIGYIYQFDNNTQSISIENNNTSTDPSVYGNMENITVISQNRLKAVFTKYFYDFASVKWQLLTITCIYTKI